LKRLHNYQAVSTGLKPGENDMKILGQSQVGPDPGKRDQANLFICVVAKPS